MNDEVRVLRILEYTYPSINIALEDMKQWGVGPDETKSITWRDGTKTTIRSAIVGGITGFYTGPVKKVILPESLRRARIVDMS